MAGDISRSKVLVNQVHSPSKEMKLDVTEVAEARRPSTGIRPLRRTTTEPLPLDKFFRLCTSQAPTVKAMAITIITTVPFAIFILVARFAVPQHQPISHAGVTLFQISKWLIVSWFSFIGLLWAGIICAAFSNWVCSQSAHFQKFQRLAESVCLRMVFMIWAGVVYAVIPTLFANAKTYGDKTTQDSAKKWVDNLHKAFLFLIISFAVIFGQGIFLELISIQYIGGWMGPRSRRATDALDTIKELRRLTNPHMAPNSATAFRRICRKLFLPFNVNDEYYQISVGRGNDDMWRNYANKLWDSIAHGKTDITLRDITEQLTRMGRDADRGHDLFIKLDQSCDSIVNQEELEELVRSLGQQLNAHARAQSGVKYLLRKLEVILSVIMLFVIFVIYVQFFDNKSQYATKLTDLWKGLTGLSFAFGGVLLEFTNACVFVFGKHAYDVGDYIEAKGKKLIVDKIFLTHTNFEEVTDPLERGTVVQISHASLMSEPIINWTRTQEEVIEKKKVKADEDKAKDDVKGAQEKQEKAEARDLILLKTAHLRNVDPMLEKVAVKTEETT